MSTLHTLNIALADIEGRLQRELQFTLDAQRQITECFGVVHEALAQLERTITQAFTERTRSVSAAIGSGKPSPETIQGATQQLAAE